MRRFTNEEWVPFALAGALCASIFAAKLLAPQTSYEARAVVGCGELDLEGVRVSLWGVTIEERDCDAANATLEAEVVARPRAFSIHRGDCHVRGELGEAVWSCEEGADPPATDPRQGSPIAAVPSSRTMDGPWVPQHELLRDGLARVSDECVAALSTSAVDRGVDRDACYRLWTWHCQSLRRSCGDSVDADAAVQGCIDRYSP